MPVMPADDPSDYLATQAIADYLATRAEPILDGLIYSSVQSKHEGVNVVLFHKSSRVEPLEIPDGTELSVNLETDTEDGREEDYWVSESVPPEIPAKREGKLSLLFPEMQPVGPSLGETDARIPALRFDVTDLKIHHVQAVSYQTNPSVVTRRRWEKRKPKF